MSIDLSIPEIQNFLNLTLKIQGEGEMAMMMHNYRSRQFHIISNGINPSSGFHWLPQSLAHVLPHWTSFGANGQITMTVHNYKSRHVHKTLNGLNPPSGFRDQHSANFSEIRIRIQNFPFMKMLYKMLSAIWWQFSPGWDQLNSFYLMGHPGEEATQCAHKHPQFCVACTGFGLMLYQNVPQVITYVDRYVLMKNKTSVKPASLPELYHGSVQDCSVSYTLVCKTSARCLRLTDPSLTLNVRGRSYLGLTRSISWLLMHWLLTSPGHQQPRYWLYRLCRSLSYLRKDFKYLCHINVEEWHKM